jgi:putative ABC transport system permease protein
MMQLDVKKQVQLPFSSTLELVLSGIRFRLFRAGITVVIISLAVTFLMTMLTESLITRQMASSIAEQTRPRREFLAWVNRLTLPMTQSELTQQLATLKPDSPLTTEFKAWGGVSKEQLTELARLAACEKIYLNFLGDMSEGDIRPLVGRVRGREIFTLLQNPQAMRTFTTELPKLNTVMVSLPEELAGKATDPMVAFSAFCNDLERLSPARAAILKGQSERASKLSTQLTNNDQNLTNLLASGDETLYASIREMDYALTLEKFKQLEQQAKLQRDSSMISDATRIGKIKQNFATRLSVSTGKLTDSMVSQELTTANGAKWLCDSVGQANRVLTEMQETLSSAKQELAETQAKLATTEGDAKAKKQLEGKAKKLARTIKTAEKKLEAQQRVASALAGFTLTPERVQEVAKARQENKELTAIESSFAADAGEGKGFMGFSGRTAWLLIVSLMVCAVGIANAMLMSVTERFREIATMKCLGATDQLILITFVLESVMQGIAGGIVGAILGLMLGLLRGLFTYGWIGITEMPVLDILGVAGGSLVIGVVLSALAAMYPAWSAARLAPMEAMRIE